MSPIVPPKQGLTAARGGHADGCAAAPRRTFVAHRTAAGWGKSPYGARPPAATAADESEPLPLLFIACFNNPAGFARAPRAHSPPLPAAHGRALCASPRPAARLAAAPPGQRRRRRAPGARGVPTAAP